MATALSNAIELTGDPRIDGLLQGSAWQFAGANYVITYSFSLNDTPAGAWNTDLRNAVNLAFTEWSNVANVTFVESGNGTVFSAATADIAVTPVGTDLQGSGVAALGLFPSPIFADAFLSDSGYSRASKTFSVSPKNHLPRAHGVFRKAGWDVIPYPVSYRALPAFSIHERSQSAFDVAIRE